MRLAGKEGHGEREKREREGEGERGREGGRERHIYAATVPLSLSAGPISHCHAQTPDCCSRSQEFGLEEPLSPPRLGAARCVSFRAAWLSWRREFAEFHTTRADATLFARCARSWGELRRWLRANAQPIADSLAPGLSREDMAATIDSSRGCPDHPSARLPLAARALYRIHNGQMREAAPLVLDSHSEDVSNVWNGIFGGYIFYDHIINLRMPGLKDGLEIAQRDKSRQKWVADSGSKERAVGGVVARSPDLPVAFAVSLATQMGRPLKSYILHNDTGHLYVPRQDRVMLCCTPPSLVRVSGGVGGDGGAQDADQRDGVVLWLEAFVASVTKGNYAVAPFLKEPLPWGGHAVGINVYPRAPPVSAVAVTNMIRIHASALFVPEKSTKGEYFFSYCMRMSLVGEGPEGSGGEAQLLSRHLVFDQGPDMETLIVDGEAVVGEYPHLVRGGGFQGGETYSYAGRTVAVEYVYASCTHIPGPRGSLMGSFKFVPGSIEDAKGAPFDVSIPRIELLVPDFI